MPSDQQLLEAVRDVVGALDEIRRELHLLHQQFDAITSLWPVGALKVELVQPPKNVKVTPRRRTTK